MRISLIALAALMAGCAAPPEQLSSKLPSLHIAAVALAAGLPAIAESVAQHHLADTPNDPEALLLRAQARAAQGHNAGATADFRHVIQLRPGSVDAVIGLSRLLLETDPKAADDVLTAFTVNGNAPAGVWNNLGVARDLLDRHAEAQAAYRNALAADPTMVDAQANLAHSRSLAPATTPLARSPSPVQARLAVDTAPIPSVQACIAAATAVVPARPGPNATFFDEVVASISRFINASHDALRQAEARLRCDPADLDERRQVVAAALNAGEDDRARLLATQTMQQRPADPRGYMMQAAVAYFQGDNRQALDSLFKARDLQRAATGSPQLATPDHPAAD